MADAGRALDPSKVIYEFVQIGSALKVTAVDPDTMTEVSIVGDPAASQDALERTALRKLQYVLAKRGKTDPR